MYTYKASALGFTSSPPILLASSNGSPQGWIPSGAASSRATPIDREMDGKRSFRAIISSWRARSRAYQHDAAADASHSLTARASASNISRSLSNAALSSANLSHTSVVSSQPVDDRDIAFRGQWSFIHDPQSFNSSFHMSTHDGDQAMLRFKGSGIAILGYANSTSGQFNATLDGQTSILNGYSSLAQPTVLFFQTGLDPSKEHSLTITNAADSLLAIGTIDVTTVSGGTSTHNLSRGVIAGIAVVSVLSFLLLLMLALLIVLRRRSGSGGGPRPTIRNVNFNLGRLLSRSKAVPDAESVFDGQPITFKAYEKEKGKPAENWSPVAALPRPPREYAPGGQRASVAWRDSLAQSDTYTLPSPRAPDRRRGSKTLLLGDMLDAQSYLSFGRARQPPSNARGSVLPQIVAEEVLDIRAPTPAQTVPSHAADASFLDIASSSSPSSKHLSFPSSSSSRQAHQGSHRSKRASRSQRASSNSGLGNAVLRSLFPRALAIAPAASSGSGSLPYPFVGQGQHGADGPPSPGGSMPQSVSDIHFRAADDITDTDGALTRPVSMPAPRPTSIDGRPNGSPVIVQRFLGMWRQPASAGAELHSFANTTHTAPAFQPPPWSLSPVSPRTKGPAGPRPPSMARR